MSFSSLLSLTARLMPVSTECAAALLSFRYPSINIYLNNCYLIKCNKQQEKISCFQRKDSTPLLNIDRQSEFLSAFPTIYCGKTRVDNHLIIFKTTFEFFL